MPNQSSWKFEPVDSSFIWANLTWTNGRGGLVWGAAPDGAAPAGVAEGDPPTLTFVAEPLSEPMYINAAHLVQLDVLVHAKSAKCGDMIQSPTQRIHAELRADETLVAGAYHAAFTRIPLPPAPEGYSYCRFRMGIESAHVPAGARLSVRLIFDGQPAQAIGVSAEAPSILRIPTFTLEEATYRMPEILPRLRPATLPAEGGTSLLPLAFASILPFGLAGRRRRYVPFLAFLVLVGGCLGASPAPKQASPGPGTEHGTATVFYQDPPQAPPPDETAGTIVGQVSDPNDRPVADAHVALLGTPHASKTDRTGLFYFRNVTAGDYQLRVDRETFTSFETMVRVKARALARVDIQLAYDGSPSAGARPHFHDLWNGEDEYVLFKGPLYTRCAEGSRCDLFSEFIVYPSSQDLGLVRPGASEVEVTLDFDPSVTCNKKLTFAVQDNADTNPANWTIFPPRGPKEPFHIKTTWEMTDTGHQRFSTWTFGIFDYNEGDGSCPPYTEDPVGYAQRYPSSQADLVLKPEKVYIREATIRIKRGALPLEPTHPDRWDGATQLELLKGGKTETNGGIFCASATYSADDPHFVLGQPTRVVPADATTVTIYLNQSRANGPAGVASIHGWQLWYKTGEAPPEPYVPGGSAYRQAARSPGSDGTHSRWDIPITATEADGIYNAKSAWRFIIVPDDAAKRCAAGGTLTDSVEYKWAGFVSR